MTLIKDIKMATRIAARDMRGGARKLWLLIAGVFIGVVAVALVGVVSQNLIDGARQGALVSVGGDLSLRLFHRPPSPAELEAIGREGEVSVTAEFRPMARAIKNGTVTGDPLLVELKGVDGGYPLYGTVELLNAQENLFQVLKPQSGVYGAVADQVLLDTMGLQLGDFVKIGEGSYQIRDVLTLEPDRAFRAFSLGPRLMVLNESLPETRIADEGAEIYYYTHVRLPDHSTNLSNAKTALMRIETAFPKSGWRMVNAHEGVPGVERTLSMAHVLLLFIGLGVMLIGGAGISGAVRAHISEKMHVIAILKSIGAPSGLITMAFGIEVMTAAFIGAVLGVSLASFGPLLIVSVVGDHIPFTLETSPSLKPLLAAGGFGLLVTALFAWWPLMGVKNTNARVLMRERVTGTKLKPSAKGWLGAGLIIALIIALIFWVSPMPVLTASFLACAFLLALLYFALGLGIARLAKSLAKGKSAIFRLALGNLYRTGAPTGPVVMALGLTLTLLVALEGIGEAASRHVQNTLPHKAPDLVAFSLKPEMIKPLTAKLQKSGLVDHQRIMPFLHARVQALGGVPVGDLKIPRSLSWVIRGDRGVSFAETLPGNAAWEEGDLDRSGFSIEESIAQKIGLDIGDKITLNIGGYIRTAPILGFRKVDWTGLDLDFPIIATPRTLVGVPYSFAASLKAKSGKQQNLEAMMKTDFPNVPIIRVSDVLLSLNAAMEAILTGLKMAALMCGLAAMVVLAGSVFQGLSERTKDAVLFKILGARRRQILSQIVLEFSGLGVLISLVAVPLGAIVAYGITRAAGLSDASIFSGTLWTGSIELTVFAIAVTTGVGVVATLGAYTASPSWFLRSRRV